MYISKNTLLMNKFARAYRHTMLVKRGSLLDDIDPLTYLDIIEEKDKRYNDYSPVTRSNYFTKTWNNAAPIVDDLVDTLETSTNTSFLHEPTKAISDLYHKLLRKNS